MVGVGVQAEAVVGVGAQAEATVGVGVQVDVVDQMEDVEDS